jgi:hypothetical protein
MKATKKEGYLIQIEKLNRKFYLTKEYGTTSYKDEGFIFKNISDIDIKVKNKIFSTLFKNNTFNICKFSDAINHV